MTRVTHRRPAHVRAACLSMIACLIVSMEGYTQTRQPTSPQLAAGQNAVTAFPDLGDAPSVPSREVARLPVADGSFIFVQQLGGEVGIVAEGQRAVATLNAITAAYPTTPLDVFVAAGGNRRSAPAALLNDYQRRQAAGGPTAPLPLIGSMPLAAAPSVLGSSGLGQVGGAACVQGSEETFDYFKHWWGYLFVIPGIGALADIGANGQEGTGIWNLGPANLNLGSTSAGAALVCFPENESSTSGARITVQEYYGNGLWLDLWTSPFVLDGVAYGYWFKGFVVHKIRVLIRDTRPQNQQNPPIGPFYWAGAY